MSDTQTRDAHRAQRRRPIIAKDWQLAVLKKLQSESGNPTEEQRLAAATETGLDEKWVRNWFTRQRSKLAARNRKDRPAHPAVQTFRVQLCHPLVLPGGPQDPQCRSPSMPTDLAPCLPTEPCRPLPASFEPHSPHPSRSTVIPQAIPRSHRDASASNKPLQDPRLIPHTSMMFTYSRDPLCNRYPDFSQFFRPQVHWRFCSTNLLAVINDDNPLFQFLPNPDGHSHAPIHLQSLLETLNPLHLGGLPAHQSSSIYSNPCPVAFSMKLVDLLSHSSVVRCPILLPSELGDRI